MFLPPHPASPPIAVHIVQLGSKRLRGEGLRIGTVRRPPRRVPKARFSKDDWYDVWFPNLAPTAETIAVAMSEATPQKWKEFVRRYRREMKAPDRSRDLDLLAALSHTSDFSVGCYCEDESRCHRSILRELLIERGASVA
jgi:uncharacterized protein YeaO (DUF488 family)